MNSLPPDEPWSLWDACRRALIRSACLGVLLTVPFMLCHELDRDLFPWELRRLNGALIALIFGIATWPGAVAEEIASGTRASFLRDAALAVVLTAIVNLALRVATVQVSFMIQLVERLSVRYALEDASYMLHYPDWDILSRFPPFALPFVCGAIARLRGRRPAAGVAFSVAAFVPSALFVVVRDPEPLEILGPLALLAFASALGTLPIAFATHLAGEIDRRLVLRLRREG